MITALFVRIYHNNRRHRVFAGPVYKGHLLLDFYLGHRNVKDKLKAQMIYNYYILYSSYAPYEQNFKKTCIVLNKRNLITLIRQIRKFVQHDDIKQLV